MRFESILQPPHCAVKIQAHSMHTLTICKPNHHANSLAVARGPFYVHQYPRLYARLFARLEAIPSLPRVAPAACTHGVYGL